MNKENPKSIANKRIGLFVLYKYLGISHSIISTIDYFKDKGRKVDVYTRKQKTAREVLPTDLKLIEMPDPPKLIFFPFNLIYYIFLSFLKCRYKNYKCFIGYDPHGLLIASVVGFLLRIHVIYHSLELWVSKDINKRSSRFKWLPSKKIVLKYFERLFHKRAIFTIVQDKRREKVLFKENSIIKGKTYYVPHIERQGLYRPNCNPDYFRKKFNINTKKKIILMIGGINKTTLALKVANSVKTWPKPLHLILHGFGTKEYIDLIARSCDDKNVTISTEMVSISKLCKLVASADIGLALYPNSDTNMYEMTSGKIGQYFRCGLPVIANDFPNLIDIVEKSGSGLCIHNIDELPQKIEYILNNWKKFRKNSYKAYLKYYNFDEAFKPVFQRIKNLKK